MTNKTKKPRYFKLAPASFTATVGAAVGLGGAAAIGGAVTSMTVRLNVPKRGVVYQIGREVEVTNTDKVERKISVYGRLD